MNTYSLIKYHEKQAAILECIELGENQVKRWENELQVGGFAFNHFPEMAQRRRKAIASRKAAIERLKTWYQNRSLDHYIKLELEAAK